MTGRRIVIAYLAASFLAVVAGLILEEIPLQPGGVPYAIVWIMLGPLIAVFYAVRDWSLEWPFVIFYLVGSALLVPGLALAMHRKRIVRMIGCCGAVVMWLVSGFLILAAAWGA